MPKESREVIIMGLIEGLYRTISGALGCDLELYSRMRRGTMRFGFGLRLSLLIILFFSAMQGIAFSQDAGGTQDVTFRVYRTMTTAMGSGEQMCNHYKLTVTRDGTAIDLGADGGTAEETNGVLTIYLSPGDYGYKINYYYPEYGQNPSQAGVTEGDFAVTEGELSFVDVDTSGAPAPSAKKQPQGSGVVHIGWNGVTLGEAEAKVPDVESLIQTEEWGEVPSNQVIVIMKEGAGKSEAESLAGDLGGSVVGFFELISLYQIETSGRTEADLRDALARAEQDPNVELSFPNQQADASETVYGKKCTPLDDPVYSEGREKGYEIVGVQRAWDLVRSSGLKLNEVHVGVTDDGLYKGFGEFSGAAKIDTSEPSSELAEPLITYNDDGTVKKDYSIQGSHGTGVMNILAADPENGGLAGIASGALEGELTATMINIFAPPYGSSPEVSEDQSDPTKVTLSGGRTYAIGSLVALKKEIESGCTILSCSWGTADYRKSDPGWAAAYKKFFEKMSNEYPNVLFVCAAGNDGVSMDGSVYWPSGQSLPNMITVGNIMNDGTKCESSTMKSSNFEVTLAAPGQESVWGRDNAGNIKNNYGGTSMATPHVSAAAALLRSLDPSLAAADIKDLLTSTGRTSVDIDGSMVPAPSQLGGRVLAIDLAVLDVINNLRYDQGLAPLSIDDALASSDLDLEAESDSASPGEWKITANVPAVEKGTDVTLDVQGGSISGSPTKHLESGGILTWDVSASQERATVAATRQDTKGCSKAVLLSAEVPPPAPETIRLIDHAMARGFDRTISAPEEVTDAFSTEDSAAMSALKIGPVTGSHPIQWRWYSPDGALYTSYDDSINPSNMGDSVWAWSYLFIRGNDAESMPGNWKVDVSLDGQHLLTEQFTIERPGGYFGPPQPQPLPTLNVEVNNDVYTPWDPSIYYCPSNGAMSIQNRIYLTGPDLSKVASVTYILHPTFENPEITTNDASNDFEIQIMAWGGFEMKAEITTKSGQVYEKSFDFTFRDKVLDAQAMGVPMVQSC
jgi:hypothetical protein